MPCSYELFLAKAVTPQIRKSITLNCLCKTNTYVLTQGVLRPLSRFRYELNWVLKWSSTFPEIWGLLQRIADKRSPKLERREVQRTPVHHHTSDNHLPCLEAMSEPTLPKPRCKRPKESQQHADGHVCSGLHSHSRTLDLPSTAPTQKTCSKIIILARSQLPCRVLSMYGHA
jgi:hypothetical protein